MRLNETLSSVITLLYFDQDAIGSKYKSVITDDKVSFSRTIYRRGVEVNQMMKVVGEEGTSTEDFIYYMKSEFLDYVYFQQDSFNEVDAAVTIERQNYVFNKVLQILGSDFDLSDKDTARTFFNQLRQRFRDWNYVVWQSDEFKTHEKEIDDLYDSKNGTLQSEAASLLKGGE